MVSSGAMRHVSTRNGIWWHRFQPVEGRFRNFTMHTGGVLFREGKPKPHRLKPVLLDLTGTALLLHAIKRDKTYDKVPARIRARYLRGVFPGTRQRKPLPWRATRGGSCRRRSRRGAGCGREKPCGAHREGHARI